MNFIWFSLFCKLLIEADKNKTINAFDHLFFELRLQQSNLLDNENKEQPKIRSERTAKIKDSNQSIKLLK